MLLKVLSSMDRFRFAPRVVSLMGEGTLAAPIRDLDIKVDTLGCPPGRLPVGAIRRLRKVFREERPDVIQGWMYHANIAASLACEMFRPRTPVIWNVRHSPGAIREEKLRTTATIWLGAMLSGRAARIVYNSVRSADTHEQLGFSKARRKIIYNGFDLEQFRPRPEAAAELRDELGVPGDSQLIGHIAHFSPMKDHRTFLGAAARIAASNSAAHFILAGIGVTSANDALMDCMASLGIGHHVHLLGERSDIHRWLPGVDVVVSSSAFGEGFANVIGEAMACGVPCVVTDVGDSAHIVGDTGAVVAPRDPSAIAEQVDRIFAEGAEARSRHGLRARARIARYFSLSAIAADYASLYEVTSGIDGSVAS